MQIFPDLSEWVDTIFSMEEKNTLPLGGGYSEQYTLSQMAEITSSQSKGNEFFNFQVRTLFFGIFAQRAHSTLPWPSIIPQNGRNFLFPEGPQDAATTYIT